MAFEGTWTLDSGLVATNAYVVIERIMWKKGKGSYATAILYKDITARDDGKEPINSLDFEFTFDTASTDNIRTQAYQELATKPALSEFTWTDTE